MIAETKLGSGDRAFDYYTRICPSVREKICEAHRCEPHVCAQMKAGRDAPTHGEAKNSWQTGTASWNFTAITQFILGIRPTFSGIGVQPAIPEAQQSFQMVREFRGMRYLINVIRAGAGNHCKLKVDAIEIQGTMIPVSPEPREEVYVEVRLGMPAA